VLTAGAASLLTGLKPNTRLYDTYTFLRYLALNSVFVVPLLILSVFYTSELLPVVLAISGLASATGLYAAKHARQEPHGIPTTPPP